MMLLNRSSQNVPDAAIPVVKTSSNGHHGARLGSVLSERKAVEIYRCKLNLKMPKTFHDSLKSAEARMKGQSVPVAEMFGVSPKTIRDIWNRRTWAYATLQLWAEEDPSAFSEENGQTRTASMEAALLRARRGRPKGSRDSKPRSIKNIEQINSQSHGGWEAPASRLQTPLGSRDLPEVARAQGSYHHATASSSHCMDSRIFSTGEGSAFCSYTTHNVPSHQDVNGCQAIPAVGRARSHVTDSHNQARFYPSHSLSSTQLPSSHQESVADSHFRGRERSHVTDSHNQARFYPSHSLSSTQLPSSHQESVADSHFRGRESLLERRCRQFSNEFGMIESDECQQFPESFPSNETGFSTMSSFPTNHHSYHGLSSSASFSSVGPQYPQESMVDRSACFDARSSYPLTDDAPQFPVANFDRNQYQFEAEAVPKPPQCQRHAAASGNDPFHSDWPFW